MITGEIPQRKAGGPPLTGPVVPYIGALFVIGGLYMIYILLYQAKQSEAAKTKFTRLRSFDDTLNNYPVSFRIQSTHHVTSPSGGGVTVFYYTVKVSLKSISRFTFKAKRRDRLSIFLWHLGPGRLRDIIAGNMYFDSRYRLSSRKRTLARAVFDRELLEAIEVFDRDYPPIRKKNGWLSINQRTVTYREGPYPYQEYLFTQHRGQLDPIIYQLTELAKLVDKKAINVATS